MHYLKLIFVIMMVLFLAGCSFMLQEEILKNSVQNNNQNYTTDTSNLNTGSEKIPNEDNNSNASSDNPISDDSKAKNELFNYEFSLTGKEYKLPFPYSQLKADGWTIDDDEITEETEISANSDEQFYMSKGKNKVEVSVINMSGNVKSVKDCKIGGIDVSQSQITDPQIFTVAKGFTTEATPDEITNAFGLPDQISTIGTSTTLTYQEEYRLSIHFFCDSEYPSYNRIKMSHYVADESDITETLSEIPEYLSEYSKPSEIGSDIMNGNVEIAGDLYCLPAPLTAFTSNGWIIIRQPGKVGAGNIEQVGMKKDDRMLFVRIKNFASYQTTPENCCVYSVSISDYDKISYRIPGNITFESTKKDVEAILPKDYFYTEINDKHSYSYSDYETGIDIQITVYKATDHVATISMSFGNWHQ